MIIGEKGGSCLRVSSQFEADVYGDYVKYLGGVYLDNS